MEKKSVMLQVPYGKITCQLDKILENHPNITNRNALAKASATERPVVKRYYFNKIQRIDLDVVARMCYVLDVSFGEMFVYEPPTQETKE